MTERELAGRRIVLILNTFEIGGTERQVLLLARYLARDAGAAVEVWGLRNPGPLSDRCEDLGIPTRIVPVRWDAQTGHGPVGLVKLWVALHRARPDAVLSFTAIPNVACGLLAPTATSGCCIWNQRDGGFHIDDSPRARKAIAGADRFIANSEDGRRFLQSVGAPSTRIDVIENGVELPEPEQTRDAWRERLHVAPDAVVCAMVANLNRDKDHETLLAAWATVMSALRDAPVRPVLVLAGAPLDSATRVWSAVDRLGIIDDVRMPGPVDDVAGLLASVEIGVLSSRSEGCPNSVLEAMAAGLPIAATDIQPIRDVVGTDQQRFLSPPGDADALATRLMALIASEDARKILGNVNRLRARERYSVERMGSRFAEVIASVVTGSDRT